MTIDLDSVQRALAALPPEKQAEVLDFIEFLRQRRPGSARRRQRPALRDETFIGMWADRDDMRDSTTWVRHLRDREWER
jgi:hypothetical protein